MNLDDKIKNAVSLFLNCYKKFEMEDVKISNILLRENGLDNPTFWQVICPMLEKETDLEYSIYGVTIDTEEEKRIFRNLNQTIDQQTQLSQRSAFYEEEEEKLRKNREKIMEEMNVLPKIYSFKINYKKLLEFNEKYFENIQSKYTKKIIVISKRGIYQKNEPTKMYQIKGKRFNTIKYLSNYGSARLEELVSENKQTGVLISKEIKLTNETFKKELQLIDNSPNLIEHSDSVGYYLNEKDYIFEIDLK